MANDYFASKGWLTKYAKAEDSTGAWQKYVAEVQRSEMDNFNTPDLDQGADSILRPGETLEDDFDVSFRKPNAEGGFQRNNYFIGGKVLQLLKNFNKTGAVKGLEEKLIKQYKSEGMGFIEAIKKAQTEASGVRYEGRMKIINNAMKETDVYSDDYVDLLDMKIKLEDPNFAKQYVKFPENLKNKTRSRHDPDWAEANFGEEYGTKLDQARVREINESIDPNITERSLVDDIDDMNIANTDEFFGRKKNSEGGRQGFMEGKLVKQGPNTGKWVVRDLYSRGDKRGSTIYFNSETEASKAIADRKTETGKQQTNAELTKKYKSLLKEEGYKSWADAPKDVKKLLKNRMSSPIKVGPSKIKEKTIKLLEEKNPINPKTGLPYTQEEYIKLTTGQKSSLSARLRGKKQKGQYQKRQGYYPEKEGNRLINYMKKAAEQQGKLPIKDRTYTNVFVDDKFVGVNDIKNNKLYTHIDYDLSKNGAKKGTVITKHPGYEGLDNFFKAAKKFKYESPDKLLGSYFSKYERVPTYNEMYNFFTVDRDAPVKAFTSNNGLTIHHQDVIAKNPTSNFQLLTTKKNTEANTIMNKLKRGEITEAKADYDLKKIGATQEGFGIDKEKITPGKGLGVAKREAVNLFKDAYKVNPNLIEDMTKKLNIDLVKLCPRGGESSGGRIGFNLGSGAACGAKFLEARLKDGKGLPAQRKLMADIIATGAGIKNFAKNMLNPLELLNPKNLIGPQALALMGAYEVGDIGYNVINNNKPIKEALGDNWILKYASPYNQAEEQVKAVEAKNISGSPAMQTYMKKVKLQAEFERENKKLEKLKKDTPSKNNPKVQEQIKEQQTVVDNLKNNWQQFVINSTVDVNGEQVLTLESGKQDFEKAFGQVIDKRQGGEFVAGDEKQSLMKTYMEGKSEDKYINTAADWIDQGDPLSYKYKKDLGKDQGRNLSETEREAEKLFPFETGSIKADYTPSTYKNLNYTPQKLPAEIRQEYENLATKQGILPPRTSLSQTPMRDGSTYDYLKDLTELYNNSQKAKQASMYPGYGGTQEPAKYAEGGLAGLMKKYNDKR
jgi:hypothetical protein